MLKKIIIKDRQASNHLITYKLKQSGIKMSKQTVQCCLHDLQCNLQRHQKPKSTQKMMQKMLEWAKNYKNLSEVDIRLVR